MKLSLPNRTSARKRDPGPAQPALAYYPPRRHHVYVMSFVPAQFIGVTVVTKANVYFDGNVVSHTVLFKDDSRKTLGLIRPGSYHFNTDAPERMEIVAGSCRVILDGTTETHVYKAGAWFDVPGKSGFTIAVGTGVCEYICSFLPA
jgi:purine/pyrimidine-nucleoside phosphorylase